MIETLYSFYIGIGLSQQVTSILTSVTALFTIIFIGITLHKILNKLFFKQFNKFIKKQYPEISKVIVKVSLLQRFLMFIVPLILLFDLPLLFGDPASNPEILSVVSSLDKMLSLYVLFLLGVLITTLINAAEHIYNQYPVSKTWPIRSYVQFFKIFNFLIFGILLVANFLNKSPATFFTGLGAAMAVIMLVFKDSILSFVASIQLASSRMMKEGDWIEIPGKDISGTVIEMSLNTIKIQNFDKTISTIPPYYVTTNVVKNWQGMFDFGARRIKKHITIDSDTVLFLDEKRLGELQKIPLLAEHIKKNKADFLKSQMTNLGIFRHYAETLLEEDNRFSKEGVMFMVRIIQQHYVGGIPLEIYAYTKNTNWKMHEHIQAEFIEALVANMPKFGLKLLQHS